MTTSSTSIQVLSLESEFHSASVVIYTDRYRLLVEAGEGIQRLAVEHKVRIGKITGILLTSGQICSIGGLPGMLLTIDGAEVDPALIVAPKAVEKYCKATNYFMDDLGRFHTISSNSQCYTPLDFGECLIYPVLLQNGSKWNDRLCFVGETPRIPGKFDIDRALQLGIPKGPLFGKLKNGSSVTLEDGRVISPELVVGEATPSQYFAIVARIDSSFEKSLFNSDCWQRFYVNTRSSAALLMTVMVHLSHIDIVRSAEYQQWLAKFGSKTQHIFIGDGCHNGKSSYLAASIYNFELNSLLGNVFPSITNIEHFQSPIPNSNKLPQELPGLRLMKYNLLPVKRAGIELPSDPMLLLEEARKFVAERGTLFKSTLEQLYSKREELLSKEPIKTAYSVVCLGTGCAVPSKFRNVSSICIYNYMAHSGILLDAGEGSWNQMMNIEPPVHDILLINYLEKMVNCPPSSDPNSCLPGYNICALQWARIINVVWISHPHADHHLGLITIINERKKAYDYIMRFIDETIVFEPLLIIAPIILQQFLYEVVDIYPELASLFLFIPNNIFDPLEQCNTTLPTFGANDQSQTHILDGRKKLHVVSHHQSGPTEGQSTATLFSGKSKSTGTVDLTGPSVSHIATGQNYTQSDTSIVDYGNTNIDSKTFSSNGSVKVTVGGKRRQFDDRVANGNGSEKSTKPGDNSSNQMNISQRIPKRTRLNPPSVTEIYQRLDFDNIIRAKERLFEAFGIVSLVNIPVIHCRQSYGIILTIKIASNFQAKLLFDRANSMDENEENDDERMEGTVPISSPELVCEEVKIVYSGDTRPCDNLIAFGKNATLLIHEATFEDDKLAEAMGKRHSTILEACEVARAMNARHLLLTHFSQRYNGVPRQFHPNGNNPIDLIDQKKQDALNQLLAEQEEQFTSSTHSKLDVTVTAEEDKVILPIIASDFMTFHNEDLVWLPYLTHVLAELFPAEEDDDEDEMKS